MGFVLDCYWVSFGEFGIWFRIEKFFLVVIIFFFFVIFDVW